MKNTTNGKHEHFSSSSPSPSLLSKIRSCFIPHKSSRPLLSRQHDRISSSSSSPSPSLLSNIRSCFIPPKSSRPLLSRQHDRISSSSSSTIPTKPAVPHHTSPPVASKQNDDPSMSQAAWTLAAGAGKLAFFIGKKAATMATEVVKGGIEIAHNQIEHNEKVKETFVCCYSDLLHGTAYHGTLHFSDNRIIFSMNNALPPHTTNEKCNPQTLPPGSSSNKTREFESKLEIKIPFGEVTEVIQVNAENSSTRYIQIRRVNGSNYAFGGFVDYYKAYNHIYSLLPLSS